MFFRLLLCSLVAAAVLFRPAPAQTATAEPATAAEKMRADIAAFLAKMTPRQRLAAAKMLAAQRKDLRRDYDSSQVELYSEETWKAKNADTDSDRMYRLRLDTALSRFEQSYNKLIGNTDAQRALTLGIIPQTPDALMSVNEYIRTTAYPIWVMCAGQPWFFRNTEAGTPTSLTENDYQAIIGPNLELLKSTAAATGLISLYDTSGGAPLLIKALGTGVAVGSRYILTNRHVVEEGGIGYEGPKGVWQIREGRTARIEFPYEYDRCQNQTRRMTVQVVAIRAVPADAKIDLAVLETSGVLPPAVSFADDDALVSGDRLGVVGYPSRPGDKDTPYGPAQIDLLFASPDGRTPFPAERLAAGTVYRNDDQEKGYFSHDASTWGGNSGSAVIDLATHKIIGLHARGRGDQHKENVAYNQGVLGSYVRALLKTLP
jgi:S1-C subfamily serine protease